MITGGCDLPDAARRNQRESPLLFSRRGLGVVLFPAWEKGQAEKGQA